MLTPSCESTGPDRAAGARELRIRKLLSRCASILGVAALTGTMMSMPAISADDATGLNGSGTVNDPYQIGSADDLLSAAQAMNDDPGRYSSSAYSLVANIDFKGAEFPGINTFSGIFDGRGHSISNLVLGTHPNDGEKNRDSRGFIRRANQATIQNLTLESPKADNGDNRGFVGGLAVWAVSSTITGNTVENANFQARGAEKVGGLIAETDGGTIANNRVTGSLVANEMPGGVSAYAKSQASAQTIEHNFISVDLTFLNEDGRAKGLKGNNAGFVVGYPGTPSGAHYKNNVSYSGSITAPSPTDGFLGRVIGFTAYDGWTAENNLANSEILINGQPVQGPGTKNQQGSDTTADQLAQQATYEQLGFDFVNNWQWDDNTQQPYPKYSYSLYGEGSADSPYEINTAEDLEFLAEQLAAGNSKYTGDKSFVLTQNLDFADRPAFRGIDVFEGDLDGAGYTISNITYARPETTQGAQRHMGLIRQLKGGSVSHLTLDTVTADAAGDDRYCHGCLRRRNFRRQCHQREFRRTVG